MIDLGPTQLKNIAEPIRVYSLHDGVPTPAKSARGPAPEESAPPRLSMVVLPFANIGGGAEQEHFVDGVTESLTTDLSRIRGAVLTSSVGKRTRRRRQWSRIAAGVGFLALVSPAWAVRKEATAPVDLELVIAVDVSTSMSDQEQRMQREGYVDALLSPEVMRAIKSGRRGKIALAYMEWARPEYQRVIVPWTVIEDPADAAGAAKLIRGQPTLPQGGTSISTALLAAARLLLNSGLESDRQVVDVSGDGPNNAGPPVERSRDTLIARGVTINGLAISIPNGQSYDMIESFPLDYVVSYYRYCVIGGPHAFVLSVGDMGDFEMAVRKKFVAEIAGPPSSIVLVAQDAGAYAQSDCSVHALGR